MTDAPLIVSATDVANEIGLARPTSAQQQILERAIRRVQAQVEGYLGQPITPREYVETGRYPFAGGWDLVNDPIIAIVTTVAEEYPDHTLTGYFTVTYTYGLDAANDPDLALIREYVIAHAAAQPAVVNAWAPGAPGGGRRVKSGSTEGQSVTWESYGPTGVSLTAAGVASELPTMASLSRWKRRGVFQRKGLTPGPFDYVGGPW